MDASTRHRADNRPSPSTVSDFSSPNALQPEQEAGKEVPGCGGVRCATDLLVLLSASDCVFDNTSSLIGSDQSSQLSMPFSDVAEDECLRNASTMHRTSVDGEVMAFSSEFKRALIEARGPTSKLSSVPYIWFSGSRRRGWCYWHFSDMKGHTVA
jgi:hypothetical protein